MFTWHLIGSGAGKVVCKAGEKIVRFNQKTDSAGWDLNICNGKVTGERTPFSLNGIEPVHGFAGLLKETAEKLKEELGTWPSSGLATLLALVDAGLTVKLSGMNLLPSIARPMGLGQRVPLACAYHNWLGERRVVLPMLSALDWPSFWLPDEESSGNDSFNPYPLITVLPDLDCAEGRKLIAALGQVPAELWLEHAGLETIQKMERLFFLSRSEMRTPNWWLYDHFASHCMSRVLYRLAQAQQACWLRA
jgi:hypothetical protein